MHEAARRDKRAEYARHLRGEHRAADHRHAGRAERLLGRGEDRHRVGSAEIRQVFDVLAPVRVSIRHGERRQQGQQNVYRRRKHNRRHEDAECAADWKAELPGRVDYRLEADERPGDHGEDVYHLHGVPALRRERWAHRGEASLVVRQRGDEHRRDARDEHTRENRVEPCGEPLAEKAHRAAERRNGQT